MPTKNICMFVRNPFTNDARVLRESTALAEVGYIVDVIATNNWGSRQLPEEEVFLEGLTIYRVGRRVAMKMPLLRYLYVIFQMMRKGRAKNYDIYHANDLDTLLPAVICAKIFGEKKLVYDSHEVQTSRTGYLHVLYGVLEKRLIRFADELIHENHTRATYINNLYGIYPKVIHNYPFFIRERAQINLHEMLAIPPGEPILLYQGGLQPGRGLEKIIEAVPYFKKGVVVFVGSGQMKGSLMRMVKKNYLEQRVKFLPKVAVQDLPAYTENAYLGFQVLNNTCFNHYSASSNKLFEYMMSGVPVIACDFPEIRRVVEKEQIGVCVDSHRPQCIADAVNFLLDYPAERERMRGNCLEARKMYNWENEKRLLLEMYDGF